MGVENIFVNKNFVPLDHKIIFDLEKKYLVKLEVEK